MPLTPRLDTPERRAFWEFVERTHREVKANPPSWLRDKTRPEDKPENKKQ